MNRMLTVLWCFYSMNYRHHSKLNESIFQAAQQFDTSHRCNAQSIDCPPAHIVLSVLYICQSFAFTLIQSLVRWFGLVWFILYSSAQNGTHRWFITFIACFTILRHYTDAFNVSLYVSLSPSIPIYLSIYICVCVWQTDLSNDSMFIMPFLFAAHSLSCSCLSFYLCHFLKSISLLNRVMATYSPPKKWHSKRWMYSIFPSKYLFVILTLDAIVAIYLFGIFIQKSNKIPARKKSELKKRSAQTSDRSRK